jgi:hypothetical protein
VRVEEILGKIEQKSRPLMEALMEAHHAFAERYNLQQP